MTPTIEAGCNDCGDSGEIYIKRWNPDEYGSSGGDWEDECVVCPCSKAAPVTFAPNLDLLWRRLAQ